MPKYTVELPIAGSVVISDVEADSKEEAIQIALERDPDEGTLSYDTLEKICEGNVCNAPFWDAAAQLVEEDEDDV